ncbi:MAG: hypothetical protein ACK50I_24770 [Burkholderiales bacterium]
MVVSSDGRSYAAVALPPRAGKRTAERASSIRPRRLAVVHERRRDALDRMIAAHALALDVTLVTNHVADFAGYPGSRIADWVEPDAPA